MNQNNPDIYTLMIDLCITHSYVLRIGFATSQFLKNYLKILSSGKVTAILSVCFSSVQPEYSGTPPEVAHFNQSDVPKIDCSVLKNQFVALLPFSGFSLM